MTGSTRRGLLLGAPGIGLVSLLGGRAPVAASAAEDRGLPEGFPAHDRERVREMVTVAHADAARVLALAEESPSLANAAWDWGFGDWESALGAAAHMGRRDIAEILLDHGARPDLFALTMLGHLGAVRAAVEAMPGAQRTTGPHGLTLLHHARVGAESASGVLAYLEGLGDADPRLDEPEPPAGLAAYLGSYQAGSAGADRFRIVEQRGRLAIEVEGAPARTLFHVGDEAFRPVGAPAVRIRFVRAGERITGVTVIDHQVVVEARRLGG